MATLHEVSAAKLKVPLVHSAAGFIPLYCEYKEQKEYVTWLGNVKKFIDQ